MKPMTARERAETVEIAIEGYDYYLDDYTTYANIAAAIRDAENDAYERAAIAIQNFRTGGPTPDNWSAWGEKLADVIRQLKNN